MTCHHLWIKQITSTFNGYQCTICQATTNIVDASTGGELDFRDNETWYSFVDPIRRDYIIKKDEEEKIKRQDQLNKQKNRGK